MFGHFYLGGIKLRLQERKRALGGWKPRIPTLDEEIFESFYYPPPVPHLNVLSDKKIVLDNLVTEKEAFL